MTIDGNAANAEPMVAETPKPACKSLLAVDSRREEREHPTPTCDDVAKSGPLTTTTCGLHYGCIFLLDGHGVLVWTGPKLTGPAGAAAGLPSTGHIPDELLVSNQLHYQRQTTTGDTVYTVSDDTAAVILRVRPAKSVEWRQS